MSMISLQVEKRDEMGKGPAGRLRRAGFIPGILYGGGKSAPLPIKLPKKSTELTFARVDSMHRPIEIEVSGGEKHMVLLKDYSAHIISREFTHIDFLRVEPNQIVDVAVPVRLVGKSQGVKDGGTMKVMLRSIKLSALPANIPTAVEVDVTPFAVGKVLHARELVLPEGCSLARRQGELALLAILGKEAEVAEVAPAADAGKPAAVPSSEQKAPVAADAKKAEGKKDSKK